MSRTTNPLWKFDKIELEAELDLTEARLEVTNSYILRAEDKVFDPENKDRIKAIKHLQYYFDIMHYLETKLNYIKNRLQELEARANETH